MTEDEAKTKWCPFFRSAITVNSGDDTYYTTNRDGVNITGNVNLCLGSGCMAWRGTSITFPGGEKKADYHCGLAGNP